MGRLLIGKCLIMGSAQFMRATFEKGKGIFRLIPVFVPRRFSEAGRRLRLHPDDYYALGTARGSIKERWFSSVIPAMNGEFAPDDEGMSYIAPNDNLGDKFLLKDAVEELGACLIGESLYERYGTWPIYSKFFDYNPPLFFHLHLSDEAAARVGRVGKPEAYYFPYQMNNHPGQLPVTYFGIEPMYSRQDVLERLLAFEKGDNRITELSRAFRIQLGTGWYTPPGVLHAPGSVLTYEPQWNSDVNAVYENVTAGESYPYTFLVENVPDENKRDMDYILSLMDWEANVDPYYKQKYFRPPQLAAQSDAYIEHWIVYGNAYFGAKELTIFPRQTVTLQDHVAFGCIVIQGYGKFGIYDAEAAIMLRFGQLSADEFFVSEQAAKEGITIINNSRYEPMVILKHFGPNHPAMP